MTFDLSTAKPVRTSKFDLATAKLVSADETEEPRKPRGILDLSGTEILGGVAETAASVGSAIVGEPLAGAFGISSALVEGDAPGGVTQSGDAVESARQALTYKPRSEGGKVISGALGDAFNATKIPAALAASEKFLGDVGYSLAGPVAGAVGASIPTALLEVLGLVGINKLRGSKKIVGIPENVITQLKKDGLDIDDLSDTNVTKIQERTAEQIAAEKTRIVAFQEQGLTPTKAQVTRNADDFQAQQELTKTDTPVRAEIENQEGILTTRFDETVSGTGGQGVASGSSVADDVVGRSTQLDSEISTLYGEARDLASGTKNVKLDRMGKTLKDLAPSDRRAGGNIQAVVGDLKAKGVMDDNFKIVGKIDVSTAEDVRKLLNELFDTKNPFGNQKLRELKESLDDDVFSVAGEDVFKRARKAKSDFEKGLSKAKVSKFDSRKTNLVRDVLENKVDPDTLARDVSQLKKYRPEDIDQLKKYLQQTDSGKVAFNDLRAEVMSDIKDAAFVGPEDALGNKALSRSALDRVVAKIGDGKLGVLFNAQERAFLKQMQELAKLREPVRGTALGKGPSAQAVASLERNIVRNPLLNDLFRGITQSLTEGFRARGALTIPATSANIKKSITAKAGAAGTLLPAAIADREQENK